MCLGQYGQIPMVVPSFLASYEYDNSKKWMWNKAIVFFTSLSESVLFALFKLLFVSKRFNTLCSKSADLCYTKR